MEKQLWEHKVVLRSFSARDLFSSPGGLEASGTHMYGSYEHLFAYRTVKNNCVLMG